MFEVRFKSTLKRKNDVSRGIIYLKEGIRTSRGKESQGGEAEPRRKRHLGRESGPQRRKEDLENKGTSKRESALDGEGTSRRERDFNVKGTFDEEIRTSIVRVRRGGISTSGGNGHLMSRTRTLRSVSRRESGPPE